jgi:hypothetical protein
MTATRYSAQAINDQHYYGEPEIIIFRDKFDANTEMWDPHEVIDRAAWPYDGLIDDEWVLADPDEVLADMGWRAIPSDSINGGWDTQDFGAAAIVEPIS